MDFQVKDGWTRIYLVIGLITFEICSSNKSTTPLLDGHSSHYCPKHDIYIRLLCTLFVLPPNTTHLTQPLDKGIFVPLKTEWRKVCHDYT